MGSAATPKNVGQALSQNDLPPIPFEDRWRINSVKNEPCLIPDVEAGHNLTRLTSVAQADGHVLLIGEPGSGKEFFADLIAADSRRPIDKYITINCAGIPASMVDSELFGHTEGSFTGATKKRDGIIAAHDGGTVFLDELGKAPPEFQHKLLRFIEYKEYRPVGSDTVKTADVRIIAATQPTFKIQDELASRFDKPILIPALRDHPTDIIRLLLRRFWPYDIYTGITPRFLLELLCYPWTTNIRQLYKFSAALERGQAHLLDLQAGRHLDNYSQFMEATGRALECACRLLDAACTAGQIPNPQERFGLDNTSRLLWSLTTKTSDAHPNISLEQLPDLWMTPLYELPVFLDGQPNPRQTTPAQSTSLVSGLSLVEALFAIRRFILRCQETTNPDSFLETELQNLNLTASQVDRSAALNLTRRYDQANDALWAFYDKVHPPTESRKQYGDVARHLDAQQRTILELKMQKLSLDKIAARLNMKRSTVHEKIVALRSRCADRGLEWARQILE